MSTAADRFASRSPADVLRLVRAYPLAWVVSGGEADYRSTLLPLLPVVDAEQRITTLVGHFARSNDHLQLLRARPRALLLFRGPHGYISPSWMHDRKWGPTWNYASAQFMVDLEFFEDADRLLAHLSELVSTMEHGQRQAWRIEELGERYRQLSRGIVGFNANVREVRARFKLGQDERDATLRDIFAALADPQAGADSEPGKHGEAQQLLRWMEDFNSHRGVR